MNFIHSPKSGKIHHFLYTYKIQFFFQEKISTPEFDLQNTVQTSFSFVKKRIKINLMPHIGDVYD